MKPSPKTALAVAAAVFLLLAFMDEHRARMFNRMAALPESGARTIIDRLEIKEGFHVADLGAGGGYFSYLFAEKAGRRGVIYAIDVNRGFLEFIEKEAACRGLRTIQTIIARKDNPNLGGITVDLIFIRNVFHHLSGRVNYFKNLKRHLKKDGRIAIVEYKPGEAPHSGHATGIAEIRTIMEKSGLCSGETIQ